VKDALHRLEPLRHVRTHPFEVAYAKPGTRRRGAVAPEQQPHGRRSRCSYRTTGATDRSTGGFRFWVLALLPCSPSISSAVRIIPEPEGTVVSICVVLRAKLRAMSATSSPPACHRRCAGQAEARRAKASAECSRGGVLLKTLSCWSRYRSHGSCVQPPGHAIKACDHIRKSSTRGNSRGLAHCPWARPRTSACSRLEHSPSFTNSGVDSLVPWPISQSREV
jgi:hypothetical protein